MDRSYLSPPRGGEIDQMAANFASLRFRIQRELEGDKYCTAEELASLCNDPLGNVGRHEASALFAVAWDEYRATVSRRAARSVRAFLRVVDGYHERSMEVKHAEQAAGWPSVETGRGYLAGRSGYLREHLCWLNLTEKELKHTLKVWDELYRTNVNCWGDTQYATYLTLLFGDWE